MECGERDFWSPWEVDVMKSSPCLVREEVPASSGRKARWSRSRGRDLDCSCPRFRRMGQVGVEFGGRGASVFRS